MHRNNLFVLLSVICWNLSSCSSAPEKNTQKPLLYVPEGLEATLWAESPMFNNPSNMDVDYRGRIWITEAVNYRAAGNDTTKFLHHSEGDRIMILEDTNHDGKADKSSVFVADKDLVSPLGIAIIGNKVYVSCSPNLIVYTDENGDDRPDKKEIFLTGFGGKDHDHSLHAVVGGPDGNLYFNTGNAGPHIVKDKSGWTLRAGSIYTGGSPYNMKNEGNMKSDDGKVWVGGLALRIRPDGTLMKVMGHNFRNSYEVAIDSYGNLWQNDNDDEVVACRTSWLMEGGNAGYFSNDGTRTWQADQRPWMDVFSSHWHQEDPGVLPVGDRTGAGAPTGIVVNEGDELGEEYHGMLLSADAGRNVIFGYHPRRSGSGYEPGKRSMFISSLSSDNENYIWHDAAANANKEKWFRPSDVAIGTDGAIYVADWYDGVVGGHRMQDSSGVGRIYRIAPKDKALVVPTLGYSTNDELIQSLKSPAINVRFHAFEILKRKGKDAIEPVKQLLNSTNPYHRARAVWLLSQTGEEGKNEVKNLLNHNDPLIRATVFRALRQVETDIIPVAEKMSKDTSSFVRREIAIALRDLSFEKTKPVLLSLAAQYDGMDKWYLEALGSAAKGHENEMYAESLEYLNEQKDPVLWSRKMSALAWRLHAADAVKDLHTRASSEKLDDKQHSEALTALAFINTKAAAMAMEKLSKSELKEVAAQAAYWLSFREGNDWYNLIDKSMKGLDLARERKINSMKVRRTKILDSRLPPDEKRWNTEEMAKDSIGGQMLLGMMAEKSLPENLYAVAKQFILNNPDPRVRIQASGYYHTSGETFSIQSVMALQSNSSNGQKVFMKSCATCHRLNKTGNDIGPELTFVQKKFDRESLLDAIIHPSAGILFAYEPWSISTKKGESYFGFLVADGKQTVVIKDLAGNKRTIPTASIQSRKRMEKSLMPEPSSLGLTEQNLADLSEYMMTLKQ